ncbi:MAG TPA: hypothetical protein VHA78_03025 [Candidatus Peribacteraceae bacterium]|nr:hypothetical protein [Candidatus Peribacteraceae bacterium]
MMYGYGLNAGLPLFFGIHMIAMAVLVIGVALFIGWAIRYLTPAQLKLWSWWLIGIGIVLCILTMPFVGLGGRQGVPAQNGYRMMNGNSYYNENNIPPMMRRYWSVNQQNASGSTALPSSASSL